jgi:hypothetical protein
MLSQSINNLLAISRVHELQQILWLHPHCLTLQQKHAAKNTVAASALPHIAAKTLQKHATNDAAKTNMSAHALPHIAAKTCSGKCCGCKRIASHCS